MSYLLACVKFFQRRWTMLTTSWYYNAFHDRGRFSDVEGATELRAPVTAMDITGGILSQVGFVASRGYVDNSHWSDFADLVVDVLFSSVTMTW